LELATGVQQIQRPTRARARAPRLVNKNAKEYLRGVFHYKTIAENFFSIFNPCVIGTFYQMLEAHVGRNCAKLDFSDNTRDISDS